MIGPGAKADGVVREDHFVITVRREIMAILCLATDLTDLKERLGRIIVAYNFAGEPVTAKDLNAVGAMAALLKDAMKPNLIQTLEHTGALVHGGPFANIAHGCNSVIATKTALKLSEITVTEAWPSARIWEPRNSLISSAGKRLKAGCGGAGGDGPGAEIQRRRSQGSAGRREFRGFKEGIVNLEKHIENIQKYQVPVVVTLNSFLTDTEAEYEFIRNFCHERGCEFALAEVWAKGGDGGQELAQKVIQTLETKESHFKMLYEDELPLKNKIETIAKEIYGAGSVSYSAGGEEGVKEDYGYGIRQSSRLHGEDPVFLIRRSE